MDVPCPNRAEAAGDGTAASRVCLGKTKCNERSRDRLWMLLASVACLGPCLLPAGEALAAPTLGTVFVIDMENHNLTQTNPGSTPQQLQGNSAAPYLDSLMTPNNPNSVQSSYATAYFNVAPGIHPSEPNYIWQEGGSNFGVLNDSDPYANNGANNQPASTPSLSGLLQARYGTAGWRSYQEDIDLATSNGQITSTVMPQSQWTVPLSSQSGTSALYTNPYNGSHQYNFAAKHDGQLFYAATNGGNITTSANPLSQYYSPLQQLQTDLTNNTLAKYNLITPNQYNDMHSSLNTSFTYHGVTYQAGTDQQAIAIGDNFLSIIVPQIMASQAYQNNGAIVIWFDETEGGDSSSFTLPEIVLSPLAKGNAYDSTLRYTHSSDLKTLEELFGVYGSGNSFLGDANTAGPNDLSDLFVAGAIPAAVPEPASIVMVGIGLGGVVLMGRRRMNRGA
jgi:hypothetical protein